MIVILLLLTILTLFYVWLKWNYSYWERNKVPGPKPTLLIGNMASTFTFAEHFADVLADMYKKYADVPYVGFYKMLKPAILLRDADLIRDILTKDFHSFRKNETIPLSEKQDKLTLTHPFFVIDEAWKETRKSITPVLSTNKIKTILPVMNSVGKDFINFIKSHEANAEFDAKQLALRFTTQNVIQSSFSFNSYSFIKNEDSEFMKAGKMLFNPSALVTLKFMIAPLLPRWVLDILPISMVPNEIEKLFRRVMADNQASRKDGSEQPNDIYQMLVQLREKQNFPEIYLLGHSVSLFLDGTETSSIALSYVLYELAANPEIQEKLHDEILEAFANHTDEGEAVDAVQRSAYFEAIISEAMRIHPPALFIAKICMQDYQLPKNCYQSKPLTIPPGTPVQIPITAIHMDEKYYPNPTKFRPERFIGDEDKNRPKGVYLAFGEGPRVCTGVRFAYSQIKIAVMHIIRNYRVKLSPSHKPIVIDPKGFLSYPKDGILVKFEAR